MTAAIRLRTSALIFVAASLAAYPAWPAGTIGPSGEVIQPGAPLPGPGAEAGVPSAAAPPFRADTDGNGLADSLEVLLDQAAAGETLDVIVVFSGPGAHGRWRSAAARAMAAVGEFEVMQEYSIIDGFRASMTAAQIQALSNVPGVVRIQENAEVTAFDTYSNDDTGATFARPTYGVDGSGTTVCILDTGINPNHEQFDSKNLTSSDFHDFTANAQATPYDDHGHGSHVAGIIAGDGQGSSSLADDAIGVASGASLRIGKVLNAQGSGSDAQVIDGIEWCASQADVDIISMSLGGPTTDGTDATSLAVNCTADPGFSTSCGPIGGNPKIVVIAAGNSGAQPTTIGAPGVAQNAITVGSFAEWSGDPARVWQDDGVYLNPFSSRGPVTDGSGGFKWHKPDIAAVGSRVLSAYINDPANPSPTAYASASGTSMATPMIAGIVALMLDANADGSLRTATNGLPHQKVRNILESTAIDRGPLGLDDEYGHGLVDAFAAVAEAANPQSYAPTEYPGYTWLPGGSVPNGGTWTYPFEVTADDVGYPVAGTMTIPGQLECAFFFFGSCLSSYWSPDLELVVEQFAGNSWSEVTADTSGSAEVTRSECPATGECGGAGRVEVVHFIPDIAGSYRFVVYPSAGDPNNGQGGSFDFEISMGPPASVVANDAPTVSITEPTQNPTEVVQGAEITFTALANDTEDGDLSASISWTSNLDGAIGTGGSVSSTSLTMGVHTVTASVTDSGNKTGSASIEIRVTDANGNLPPTAGFSFNATELAVDFTDTSTDPDGAADITSRSWTFGDGATSTGQTASHTYAAAGTYDVTLTITDTSGATDSVTQPVTVEQNQPPVASFTVDRNPCGSIFWDNRCQFTDTSTDDGSIVSRSWDFAGGSQVGGFADAPLVQFSVDSPTPVTVRLTVTDNDGATNTATLQVQLSQTRPSVLIASPTTGTTTSEGDAVNFSGTASDAQDGNLTSSIAWSSSLDGSLGTGGSVSTSSLSAGTHTITASVTDSGGMASGSLSDTDSITLTVAASTGGNTAPTADFTFTTSDLTADFSDASNDDGSIVSWSWTFGDGSSSSAQNPSHSYATAGSYSVSLTVEDDGGLTDQHSATVTVTEPVTLVHLGNLDDASVSNGGRWDAQVAALVLDSSSNPVSGATVSGGWSNGTNGNGSCTTSGAGWCLITKPNLKNNVSSVTFTVGSIGGTNMEYQVTANADPDGESYGSNETSIDLQPGAATTNQAPTASFTETCINLACSFDGTGSSDSDGTIQTYSWDFGGGATGTGISPDHTFSSGGTYTVTLTVTDDDGATGTTSNAVSVTGSGGGSTAPITLNATGRKVQGVHTIDLGWTPADGGIVSIIRNGVPVTSTPDNGSYTDSTGNKGGGSYNMQICETDSGDCSNIATVTF